MIRNLLFVALGGAFGAALRYSISLWIREKWPSAFPWGTLTVNVIGCLLMGVLAHASQEFDLSPATRLALMTGVLGAMTTFSTFSVETMMCLEQHSLGLAVSNVAANVILSLAAVAVGLALARAVV